MKANLPAILVYPAGLYIIKFVPEYGVRYPPFRAAPGPLSSQMESTYVASANATCVGTCSHSQGFHTTCVVLPGKTLYGEVVGPTRYVLPLAEQEATMVSDVGVTLLSEKNAVNAVETSGMVNWRDR